MTDTGQPPPIATPRISAGAVFVDDAGAVLMVRPTYKAYWEVPGGYVEPGESPLAGCVREIREELGINPPIGRLLVVDWAPAEGEGDKLLFLFDGGTLSVPTLERIELQEAELDQHAYVAAADLPGITIPRLVRRLLAALAARADGTTRYLEHGS
jgi:8-oxo-dGTP diphosphatase